MLLGYKLYKLDFTNLMSNIKKNLKIFLQYFLYRFYENRSCGSPVTGIHFRRFILGCSLVMTTIIFSVNNSAAQLLTSGTIGIDQTNCTSGTFDPSTISSVSPATGTSITYQWAFSTVNNTYNAAQWINISGATGLTYDPSAVSKTTYYVRLARSGAGTWSPSNVITVTINSPGFYIDADNNSPSCNGGVMNFTGQAFAYGSNLVTNGDFSGGNSGFSSDFGNTTTRDTADSNCDRYRIASLPVTNWSNCPDVGHGNVLLANNEGNAIRRPWYQAGRSVTAGTTYTFSIKASSISWQNFAQLYLTVNGTAISSVVTLPSPCDWVTITGTYTAPATTTVTLAVVNQNGSCTGNNYMLDDIQFRANVAPPAGSWSWTGPNSFTSSAQNPSIPVGTASNVGTYTATFTSGGCTAAATTTTSLKANPTVSATNGGSYCTGSTIALTANTVDPNSPTGSWSWTGPNSFTSSARNPTIANATTAMAGLYSVVYTSDSCGYTVTSSTTVVVNSVTVNAGSDQGLCSSSFTMAGNTPSPGSGVWTVVSGTATITTPTSPTTTITGVPAGTSATLRWSVTSAPCTVSDDVIVTNNSTAANAGADQNLCNTSSFTMNATAPIVGTGAWTVQSGTATITTPTSRTTTITGVPAGTSATLRWTVTNGSCSSFDDVDVNNNFLSVADAGPDKNQCANGNFTMSGTPPSVGTGVWTFSGANNGAVITSTGNARTTVTGLAANSFATLVWTVTNGVCVSRDTSVLSNFPLNSPGCNCDYIYSVSGPDTFHTAENHIRILNTTNGTYGAQFGANFVVRAYGIALDTNYRRFYYTSSNPSSDLRIYYLDAYGANFNTGVNLPTTTETYNRAGFNPVDKKVYFVSSGGSRWASYTPTPSGAGGTVSTLSPVNYYPASAIPISNTNGGGDIVFDYDGNGYILTNAGHFYKAVFNPDNSVDVIYLGQLTLPVNQLSALAFGLDGNLYLSGRGAWNGTNYSGVDIYKIDLETLVTTKINTTLAPSTTDFSSCSFPIYRSTIGPQKSYTKISGSAGAGIAQGDVIEYTIVVRHTGNISIGNLKLLDMIPTGTSYVANSGTLNGTAATDTLSGFRFSMAGGFLINSTTQAPYSGVIVPNDSAVIKFRVRIDISCGSISNTATLTSGILNFTQQTNTVSIFTTMVATSDAGPATMNQCNNGTFTMAANVPPVSGGGVWTRVSGSGSITTPSAYNTTITGIPAGGSGVFRWTVNNGACSSPVSDDITLSNSTMPTSNAGGDQSLCNTSTFTLNATTPVLGTGSWSLISGTGNITNSTLINTTVTGVPVGTTATLRWSVTNGGCIADDDVVITNINNSLTANAGSDIAQCNSGTFTMAANDPALTTKTWTLISGTATIGSNTYNTSITSIPVGTSATLRWTVSNGTCSVSDDITLTNNIAPTVSVAATNGTICSGGSSLLTATVTNGSGTIGYQWQSSTDNVSFGNIGGATSATYNASSLTATTYYRVVVSFSGSGCSNITSSSSTITVVADPSVSVSATNAIICSGGASLLTATVSNGTGTTGSQWQISTDNVTFTDIAGAISTTYSASGLTASRYYRVNITQTGNGCNNASSTTTTITVVADPVITASVPESTVCSGGSVVISATYTGGTGTCGIQWQTRTDGVSPWTNIPTGTGNTYTTPALTTSNRYRAVISCSGDGCCD